MSLVEARTTGSADWSLARFVVVRPKVDAAGTGAGPTATSGDVESSPTVDDDGLLRYQGRWVAVPEAQVPAVRLLVDRFQTTVADDDLLATFVAEPDPESARKLAGGLHRLRKRLRECGLVLSRVRGRGYILDHAHATVRKPSESAS